MLFFSVSLGSITFIVLFWKYIKFAFKLVKESRFTTKKCQELGYKNIKYLEKNGNQADLDHVSKSLNITFGINKT